MQKNTLKEGADLERIIIVDDDIKVRRGLVELINWKEIGAEVVLTAKNGKEAADYLMQCGAAIVISDIRMPVMDGLELAGFIKDNHLDVSVILLSAYSEFAYAQRALALGVQEYILKPINRAKLNELADKVKQLIDARALKTEHYKKIYTLEFVEKVNHALKSMDINGMDELVNNTKDIKSFSEIKEYYLRILSLFAEYASENGIRDILPKDYIKEISQMSGEEACKRYVSNCFAALCDSSSNEKTELYLKIQNYIEMSYGKMDLSTASIAEHFGFSSSYISTIFKSAVGITITQYITDCRMKNAVRLLKESHFSINEISVKCGYSNLPYFYRTFKECFGVAPALFREKESGKE